MTSIVQTEPTERASYVRNRKTVLLVDSEQSLRLLLRATLGTEHFDIVEAADGEEALMLARAVRPDLVILDIELPGTDGFRVCQMIRSDPELSDRPIVMLTAWTQPAARERGVQLGVARYITKPFSPFRLVETVHELLELNYSSSRQH